VLRAGVLSALLAAALAFAAALWTMTPDPVGVFLDDALYLHTARAIAEGRGVVHPFLPGAPAAIHFPPGWSAPLAIVWRLVPDFPTNVAVLKLVNPVLVALAAALAVQWAQRRHAVPPLMALGVVVISIVTIPVLVLTNVLLSEPLFLVVIVVFALVVEGPPGRRTAALAGGMAGIAMLVRSAGIVLVLGTIIAWCMDRRWRDAASFAVVAALCIAPWEWYVSRNATAFPAELAGMFGAYRGYVGASDGIGVIDIVRRNVADAWRLVGIIVSPLVRGALRQPIILAAVCAGGLGLRELWRSPRARPLAVSLIGYLALVLVWPFQVDRFLFGLWPMWLLVVAVGLRGVWVGAAGSARQGVRIAIAAVALVLTAGHLTYSVRALWRGWAGSASRQMAAQTAPLVHAVRDEPRLAGRLLATDAAPLVALYTGATVVPVERFAPLEHLVPKSFATSVADIEAIDRAFHPAAYIVLRDGAPAAALVVARLAPDRTLREISPPDAPVRTFLVDPP
jgi:hypothetical protein